MTDIYEAEITGLVIKLKAKNVPTGNPVALARILVLASAYGQGDPLAGMQLDGLIKAYPEDFSTIYERFVGKRKERITKSDIFEIIRTLNEKYDLNLSYV